MVYNEVFGSVGVCIEVNKLKYMLLGVYRSPPNSLSAFNTLFPAILNLLRFNSYDPGDFNVDVCANYLIPSVCDFKDIFECEGYNSIVNITASSVHQYIAILKC